MQNTSSLVSRETLIKLMETQGYDTSEYENISLTETNAKYTNNQLDMLFDTASDNDVQIRKTYVNYHIEKAMRPAYIHDTNDTLVIVTKDDPHDTIINTLKHLWEKDGYFVIIHHIKRLQFNILDHNLVPSHRLLKDNEITEVKTRYNIAHSTQFPDISRFDPVALAIGMRPGAVCEISRPSKTSITGVYYRVCV